LVIDNVLTNDTGRHNIFLGCKINEKYSFQAMRSGARNPGALTPLLVFPAKFKYLLISESKGAPTTNYRVLD
jgi:hypothetical protein